MRQTTAVPTMALFRSSTRVDAGNILSGLLGLADAIIVGVTGIVAFLLTENTPALPTPIVTAIALGAVLLISANQFLGSYGFDRLRRFQRQAVRLAGAWILVMLTLAALAYLAQTTDAYPRSWAVTWFFTALAGMVLARALAAGRIAAWYRSGRLARRIAIIGAGEKGSKLVWYLQSLPAEDVTVVGIYDDRTSRAPHDIAGIPIFGNTGVLLETARRDPPDMIIIALPGEAVERLNMVLRALEGAPAEIKFCPDIIGAHLPMLGLDYIGELGLLNVTKPRTGGLRRTFESGATRPKLDSQGAAESEG
jgi:FlaA1/EpsC-like NDP-sugar epimerase